MIEDEYYNRYLNNKLELLFNDNGEIIDDNPFYSVEKKTEEKIEEPKKRYTCGKKSVIDEELQKRYPFSHVNDECITLDNGILGIKTTKYGSWLFPEVKIYCMCFDSDIRLFDNGCFSIGPYLFDKNKKMIHNGGNSGLNYHYDLFNDNYFVVESNKYDKKRVYDINGVELSENPEYGKYEVRNNCILIRDNDAYSDRIKYKVLLKDGTLLDNGRLFYAEHNINGVLRLYYENPLHRGSSNYTRRYTAILSDGKVLDDGYFSDLSLVHNDRYILANQDGNYKIYDKKGNKVIDTDFTRVIPYRFPQGNGCYFKGMGTDHKECLFDEKGNVFSRKSYDHIDLIDADYAQVYDDKEYKIIDKDGNVVHNNKDKPYNNLKRFNNVFLDGDKRTIVVPDSKLKNAGVTKQLFGYSYNNGHELVRIKYEPVMLYGDFQALCLSNEKELYLYNMIDNSYTTIGYITNIRYNDHFIESKGFIGSEGTIYFPYKEQLLDITEYYNKNLKDKKNICINEDIGEVLSKNEFVERNKGELKLLELKEELKNEKLREEQIEAKKRFDAKRKEEERQKQELLRKQEENKRLKEISQKKDEEAARKRELKAQYLGQMRELAKSLALLDDDEDIDRITIKNLYDDCGDHLEIKEDYSDYLDVIDLSRESFKNVKISGLNFKGSNVIFNPQVVYNKDMSNCNFEGVHFSPFASFAGVNIEGSSFSPDNDRSTIDTFNSSISRAIYNDQTRINGKSVEEYLALETKINHQK